MQPVNRRGWKLLRAPEVIGGGGSPKAGGKRRRPGMRQGSTMSRRDRSQSVPGPPRCPRQNKQCHEECLGGTSHLPSLLLAFTACFGKRHPSWTTSRHQTGGARATNAQGPVDPACFTLGGRHGTTTQPQPRTNFTSAAQVTSTWYLQVSL